MTVIIRSVIGWVLWVAYGGSMALGARQGSVMASVLFTDLVDSTGLGSRWGDEAADGVRRAHDEALTVVITAAGGVVVKSLGDGLMAVFDAAADAVGAAVGCQQAVAAMDGPEPLVIRVGVSVGDVTFEDDDCHGSTVNGGLVEIHQRWSEWSRVAGRLSSHGETAVVHTVSRVTPWPRRR